MGAPARQTFASLETAQAALDLPLYRLDPLPDGATLDDVQIEIKTHAERRWTNVYQSYRLPDDTWLELTQMITTAQYASAGWGQARYAPEACPVTVGETTGYVVRQFGWWMLDWRVGDVGFELRAPVTALSLEDMLAIADEEIFPLPGEISWFPNGRYLLAGRYDKYVIEVSTGQVSNTFVTSLNTDVFWSPDGERLIFTSEQVLEEGEKRPVQSGNAFSMAVLEIGQQEPRILCEGTRETDYFPLAWLPDGRVFYERVERGSDGRISQITHWTIHLDDKDSEPQPAQDIPFAFDENAQRTLLPAEFQNAWSLSLSADERWLIFTWRDRTADARVPSDPNGVYLFDLKEDGEPVLLAYGDQPAWRPGLTE